MAPRSKIESLPEDLLEQLDERLKASGYFDIDGHHAWLVHEIEQRGIECDPISRSAVGRYSRQRKRENMSIEERVQEVRAFESEFGDDPLTFVQSGNNIVQMLAYQRSVAALNGDVTVDEDFLKGISLALSRTARTAVINDERIRNIREDERKKAKEDAAKAAESSARKAGVSPETIEAIRRDVLGMS